MIIKKMWRVSGGNQNGHRKEGWYLVGLIPLYIRTVAIPQ